MPIERMYALYFHSLSKSNILNSFIMDCEFGTPSIVMEQSYSSLILMSGDLRVTVCCPALPLPLLWNKSLSYEYAAFSSTLYTTTSNP